MPTRKQKIAIARILSDLIKSDNIIEKVEIEQFNTITKKMGIKNDELQQAQKIKLSQAMSDIKGLSADDKNIIYEHLLQTANADSACVAREALILLTLKLVLNDPDDKFELLSYDTHGSYTNDKFVIYIESEEYEDINKEIIERYDNIVNLLKLWKFDFIYLPKVAERFKNMDEQYLKDIIRYMNPKMDEQDINNFYDRLTHIDTHTYVREILVNNRGETGQHDTLPALLINIGTSIVPYLNTADSNSNDKEKQGIKTYTEFLKINLDTTEENCVHEEIRRFLAQYQDILTEPEYYRPDRNRDIFKYFGFYKTLFDIFSRINFNKTGKEININFHANYGTPTITMQGVKIRLTRTELAIYMLLLQQTFCSGHDKLRRRTASQPLTDSANKTITNAYNKLLALCHGAPVANYNKQYKDETTNVSSSIAHIRRKISESAKAEGIDEKCFMPQDTPGHDAYFVSINPEKIHITKDNTTYTLESFMRHYKID